MLKTLARVAIGRVVLAARLAMGGSPGGAHTAHIQLLHTIQTIKIRV